MERKKSKKPVYHETKYKTTLLNDATSNSKNLPEKNQQNKNEYDFPLRLDDDIMVLDREFSCVTHENDFLLFMNSKNYDCSNAKFNNLDATYLFGRQEKLQ